MKNKTLGLHSSRYGICNGLRAALSGAWREGVATNKATQMAAQEPDQGAAMGAHQYLISPS